MTSTPDPYAAIADIKPGHLQSLLVHGAKLPEAQAFALEFARRLNCLDDNPTCSNCRLFAAGNFSDLMTVQATEKPSLGIEEVRTSLKRLNLSRTNRTKVKVAVIAADQLTREAQNALLKTVEEPPADTLVMMLTTKPMQLLPTIRSRTRLVKLPRQSDVDSTQAAAWLAETPFARFITAKKHAESGDVAQFLSGVHAELRKSVAQFPEQAARRLTAVEKARTYAASGVSGKVVLENLALEVR